LANLNAVVISCARQCTYRGRDLLPLVLSYRFVQVPLGTPWMRKVKVALCADVSVLALDLIVAVVPKLLHVAVVVLSTALWYEAARYSVVA